MQRGVGGSGQRRVCVRNAQGLDMAAVFSQKPAPGVYPNQLSKIRLYFSTAELILGLISGFRSLYFVYIM